VDLVARTKLLAQQADRHLGNGQRVEGVDPLPRRRRGVRLLALVRHVEVVHRQARRLEAFVGPGMDHHRGVHVAEVAGVDQVDLAAAAFFTRGAQQDDGNADLVGDGRESDGRAQGCGGDDVVSAGVAHVGQGVVLGAQDDVQFAGALGGAKGGGQVRDAALDLETRGVRCRGDRLGTEEFLVANLGMGVNEVAQLE